MIKFLTNLENMNHKLIAENQKTVTGFFVIMFIVGLLTTRPSQISIQATIFHAVLLLNTYFSIRCFGKITPDKAPWQRSLDLFLVLMYSLLPFAIRFPSLYILVMILLFGIASLKYTMLLGVIPDVRLLRRKIAIDLSGVFWNYLIFVAGSLGLLPVGLLLWIWVGVFMVMNWYLLKIKPMYCLTTP